VRCVKKLSFISRSKLIDIKSDLVIIPLYSSALNAENWGEEREILEQLKDLFQRDIYTDLKRLKFSAVSFSECVLYAPSQMEALSVALVGLGEKRDFSEVDERKFFRTLGGQISRLCSAGDYKTVAIVGVKDSSFLSAQNQEVLCEGIELGAYKFDRYKWKRKKV
jgi:leucyl aminopeptidase